MFAFEGHRNEALRNWANGDRHCEAAVELLIDHGSWLAKLDEAGLLSKWNDSKAYARPDLAKALEMAMDPNSHVMYASSSELRILQIAASLVHGTPVQLSHVLAGLDAGNQMRVARAMCTALGGVATVDHRF